MNDVIVLLCVAHGFCILLQIDLLCTLYMVHKPLVVELFLEICIISIRFYLTGNTNQSIVITIG